MHRIVLFCLLLIIRLTCAAQEDNSRKEAGRIIGILASDSMEGRQNFTPSLHRAAHFIADEFRKDSLGFLPGFDSYFDPFTDRPLPEKAWKDKDGNYDPNKVLLNVIGVLKGDSLPEEVIIFSAHYDHIGGDGPRRKDRIYNGANDDASGTTALLMLAQYYAKQKNNRRTLIFCAFSGEELGLYGSKMFASKVNASRVVAVINIEMIGRTNVTGNNSIFLTGPDYSNLYSILQKNLASYPVSLIKDPEVSVALFMRSDNYPFALKGIPAHTIMCSDDRDPCYHQPCDEVSRIDLANMTRVIKAIPVAVRSLVDGKDRPSRIHPNELPILEQH